MGHRAHECRSLDDDHQVKCYNCHKLGHRSYDCPDQKQVTGSLVIRRVLLRSIVFQYLLFMCNASNSTSNPRMYLVQVSPFFEARKISNYFPGTQLKSSWFPPKGQPTLMPRLSHHTLLLPASLPVLSLY